MTTTGHQSTAEDRADHDRPRDEPLHDALHQEHPADHGAHADLRGRAAEHLGVPRVLLALVLADRAAADVPGQPQPPHGDQAGDQPAPPAGALVERGADDRRGQGDEHEAGSPGDVDDGGLVELPGPDRRDAHADGDRDQPVIPTRARSDQSTRLTG